MPDLNEDNVASNAGRELYLRNMRKVLMRKGYTGDALEQRIAEVLARDPSRLVAILAQVGKTRRNK